MLALIDLLIVQTENNATAKYTSQFDRLTVLQVGRYLPAREQSSIVALRVYNLTARETTCPPAASVRRICIRLLRSAIKRPANLVELIKWPSAACKETRQSECHPLWHSRNLDKSRRPISLAGRLISTKSGESNLLRVHAPPPPPTICCLSRKQTVAETSKEEDYANAPRRPNRCPPEAAGR